jgi:hypothetical protein
MWPLYAPWSLVGTITGHIRHIYDEHSPDSLPRGAPDQHCYLPGTGRKIVMFLSKMQSMHFEVHMF